MIENKPRGTLPALVLIFLIAAAFRIWALDSVPPGLQHDEIFHAHDAFTVRQGNLQLWFTSNAGNEPLYIYLMALTTGTIGGNVIGIRFTALLMGMLTLAFTYRWAARAVGHRAALIAIAFMAVSFWPIFLSRVGLRVVMLPPMAALTLWLYTRAIDFVGARHALPLHRFIIAGVALGLTLYTYPAANALPIIFIAFTAYLAIFRRDILKHTWRGQIVFWLIAALIYAPLIWAISASGGYLRVQQTAAPLQAFRDGNPQPLIDSTWQTLLMWTTRGDPIWRYNVAERPVFDPALSVVFLIGVGGAMVMALRRSQTRHGMLIALILLSMLLGTIPSAVTETPPSFLRASTALPATYIVLALGVEFLAAAVPLLPRLSPFRYAFSLNTAILLIAATLLLDSAMSTARDYFVRWANDEEVQHVYLSDMAAIAAYLRTHDPAGAVAISGTHPHDLDPFIFAYTPHGEQDDIHWYDGKLALIVPTGDVPTTLFITREPIPSPRIQAILDAFPLREDQRFMNGAIAYQRYEIPPAEAFLAEFPPPTDQGVWVSPVMAFPPDDPDAIRMALNLPVQFGDMVELIGYRALRSVTAGGVLEVDLHFRVLRDITTPEPWAIFAHVIDANGNLVAGQDFLAAPPHTWRTGDVFIQLQDTYIPPDLAAGLYHLEIGLYTLRDGSRFPVIRDGQPVGDRLLLEAVEVIRP